MIRVLVDVNVVLDVVLNRAAHVEFSAKALREMREKKFVGYVAATTITTIYYVAHKLEGRDFAEKAVEKTLLNFEVLSVDRSTLYAAWSSHRKDFEDAVQIETARAAGIDTVVTRDKKGFLGLNLNVYTPETFLEAMK